MSRREVYEQVYDKEPFELPLGKTWCLACCHCGLVHDVKIETPGNGNFKMTVRQNKARTKRHRANVRNLECKPVKKKPR